ncbi:MAG: tRNA (N6-isopentenyl adenosine(37)-C2)-methylthiotransferase MiaB [Bacteroidetes bacterium CG2_30_32_10]|nr:MAG: tRNA (N6-isopentenyl adenosine(37)-C2)-methylthiotransferase MiaB [Bacteroidetes bacterium CG2_30_32_10]
MGISKKLYIETYGCQMNVSDSEIVGAIMKENDFDITFDKKEADVIFINTCSIRDNAEQRIRKRLLEFHSLKKQNKNLIIGILGCMAERLKEQLLEEEKIVDIIAGPDAYRHLPQLLASLKSGQKAIDVMLSLEETYADINPIKYDSNGITAFISIMRGCENFCSYCVVPYTRGKERSRNAETIINEAKELFERGYREITLLGQNVNSYICQNDGNSINFAKLLEEVALINPLLRVRFATSHPKDISDELIYTIAKYENICKSIHLPVQSGSNRILELMNRKYTREYYMSRVDAIKRIIPECAISTDIIAGFCSENDEDQNDTLSLMEWVKYDFVYMFNYSERPNTAAAKKYKDDVPENVKIKRLQQIIDKQQKLSMESNLKDVGKVYKVLVENISKRSAEHLAGRNSQNKMVVFPKKQFKLGDYVQVIIKKCTAATLIGEIAE